MRVKYSKEVMDKALEAVKSGTPINTACKWYKVPRLTLHSKLIHKYKREKTGPNTKLKKENPFVDGQPGRHWYKGFLRRYPMLRKRICENVSLSRALVSEDSVRQWFKHVGDYLKKENLENINGSRIFNIDGTALLLSNK
ncbi:hypothetical protein ALC62_11464 [Cyphomyrmex costatus]|uniref:HTH psq-type domain-containing protein n=1 Tax=Cyphomyrmex costatus TaxID=456900 RepID=A0A151ICS3_9HYME|nr:hypothetical protein ALC62_11464 [Cyphomyrmex costatus]